MDKKITTSNTEQIDFIDLIKPIVDQKIIVIFCVLSFVAFSAISSYVKTPLYKSNVRLITAYYDNKLLQSYSELSPHVKFFFDDVGISNLKNGYIKLSTTGESVDGNELKLNEVIEFILDDSKQKINKHKNLLLNDIFLVKSRISQIDAELTKVGNGNRNDNYEDTSEKEIYLSSLRLQHNEYLLEERTLEAKKNNPNLFSYARKYGDIESSILSTNYFRKILSFAILGFIVSILIIFTKKALIEIRNTRN